MLVYQLKGRSCSGSVHSGSNRESNNSAIQPQISGCLHIVPSSWLVDDPQNRRNLYLLGCNSYSNSYNKTRAKRPIQWEVLCTRIGDFGNRLQTVFEENRSRVWICWSISVRKMRIHFYLEGYNYDNSFSLRECIALHCPWDESKFRILIVLYGFAEINLRSSTMELRNSKNQSILT